MTRGYNTRLETKPLNLKGFDCKSVKRATKNIEILKYILRIHRTENKGFDLIY